MSPRALKGNPDHLKFKKKLRSEMTDPERRLWSKLRSRQFMGLKFRRQHGIGPYIVDFYCPEISLVIEIDGETHGEDVQVAKDEERDVYLRNMGLKVLRYMNSEIVRESEGVMQDLMEKVETWSTSPCPSLQRRGE